ncbi:MAG: amino acid adenylation domain-containing protein, partial [bacterium]|nr:amino acid adenylation domain-containing protein [bacterium]
MMEYKKKNEEVTIAAGQFLKEKEYWIGKLAGELRGSSFHFDYIHAGERNNKLLEFSFPSEQCERLLQLSNESDSRLFMILAAGLAAELFKYNSEEDIILGTTIEKQEVRGEYINNILPLRNRVHRGMTFKEMLLQMRETLVEAAENSNYPMEKLVRHLNVNPFGDEFPLFATAVLLENIHSREYLSHVNTNITFILKRTGKAVIGEVQYNSTLFEKKTVERIVNHYLFLMGELLFRMDEPLWRFEILSKEEKHQLLEEFNDSSGDFPREKTLHRLFEEQVEKTPQQTALSLGDQTAIYRELDDKAARLARVLQEKGAGPGIIIGLMTDVSIEMVVGMLAILKAGGAFLPIEPDYPHDRIQYMLDDGNVAILLVHTHTEGNRFDVKTDKTTVIRLQDPALYQGPLSEPGETSGSQDIAYVIYTSGSTGKPKGVMIQHNHIVNQIYGFEKKFYRDCRLNHMLIAPFTFDPSVQHIFSPLCYGGRLFLVPASIKDDAVKLAHFIRTQEIDVFDGVPSQMDLILQAAGKLNNDEKAYTFKYIILAGEVFAKSLYYRIRKGVDVEKTVNIYGPTEASINTTMYECGEIGDFTSIPIGTPLMNYKVFVMDKERQLLPIGVPGEIYIGGESVARGYLNNPGLTREKFVENPHLKGERIYRTGDFGRWLPDG